MKVRTFTDGVLVEERDIPDIPEVVARDAIAAGINQGMSALQQILDAPQVSFSNISGAQTAMRDVQTAIKAEARQLRRLSRLALGLLDGTE